MEIDLFLIGWIVFGVFAAVTCIQILYYILLFSRLAFHQSKAQQTTIKDPVSVVICARDEAGNLARNLPGVLVQDYTTHHEIIVVNDNSQDETKYLLDEFKKSFDSLKVVELSHEAKLIPGKKYPLSMGIISAKNE
ncbi:MAG: glycosyltransferase, partial [Chitinophagaceae bacterium]